LLPWRRRGWIPAFERRSDGEDADADQDCEKSNEPWTVTQCSGHFHTLPVVPWFANAS